MVTLKTYLRLAAACLIAVAALTGAYLHFTGDAESKCAHSPMFYLQGTVLDCASR